MTAYARDGGVLDPVTDDTPQFVKEYHDYYKTERGYHRRSPELQRGNHENQRIVIHQYAAAHLY